MAFSDLLENPSRTILTDEGDKSAFRFNQITRCENGRYRKHVPDEQELLQTFARGWTDTGMTDGHRAFCMEMRWWSEFPIESERQSTSS